MAGDREGLTTVIDSRGDVLEYLAAGPHSQAEIADALDVSRSTVTRAIQDLQEYDLVERAEGEYRTSRLGEALLESHRRYLEEVAGIVSADTLFEHLPRDAPFESWLLNEGTFEPVEPGASFQVRERVNEQFKEAVRIVGMGRTRSERESASVYYEKVIEEDRPVENVLSVDLYRHIQSLDWSQQFFGAENLDIQVHELVPYGLFVVEKPETETMIMVIYDDEDAMKGVILSESPSAIGWARDVYESYRNEAVPPSGLDLARGAGR